MLDTFDTTQSNDDIDDSSNSGSLSGLQKPQEPKPKRSPTVATKRSSQEMRTLNHLLTAAGFKGTIRGFITAVWGVSEGTDVFSACHAQVGTHGHDNRSEEAAKAYVRYWLEQLEPIQAQLGVWFIRFTRGKIDPDTGEHITTHYDCSLLYDAINAMAAPEVHTHRADVRAQRIVDQLRVEPVPIDTDGDIDELVRAEKDLARIWKAIATQRLKLAKAVSSEHSDPLVYFHVEIDRAKRTLERLKSEPLLKSDHRGEGEKGETGEASPCVETDEKGETAQAPLSTENEEIGPSLLGERARKPHPLPALNDLAEFAQWVAWYYLERPNKTTGEIKLTKPPINPHTGGDAKVSDPDTWGTYQQAVARGGTKVGFVMTDSDPFAGIDIDHCIDEAGEIEGWAQGIIGMLDSYAERSPSGRGVRIFIRGSLPGKGLNRRVDGHKIELYDRGRYLTFTGDHIEGTPVTIEPRHTEVMELYGMIIGVQETLLPQEKPEIPLPPSCDHSEGRTNAFSDDKVIELSQGFKTGAKFTQLFLGNMSGYKSQNEADLELCALIAYVTQDGEQIDRIFSCSGLWRDKWKRADYRANTIEKAIRGLQKTYQPRG